MGKVRKDGKQKITNLIINSKDGNETFGNLNVIQESGDITLKNY